MALPKFVFRYKKQVITDPVTQQRVDYYTPMLPCVLDWQGKRTPHTEGLLDSGSDGIVLPLGVARFLDLRLEEFPRPMKVVGREVPRYSARANLTIGRGGRSHTFSDIEVAVPTKGETPIILGRNPVFKVYKVTFVEPELKFVLDPYE